MTGIPSSAILRWERHNYGISSRQLERLAALYGIAHWQLRDPTFPDRAVLGEDGKFCAAPTETRPRRPRRKQVRATPLAEAATDSGLLAGEVAVGAR
jgi:hypothetical protein